MGDFFLILGRSEDSSSPHGRSVQHYHVCWAKFTCDSGDAKGELQSGGRPEMCHKKIRSHGRAKDASTINIIVREFLQMKMTWLDKFMVVLQMKCMPLS